MYITTRSLQFPEYILAVMRKAFKQHLKDTIFSLGAICGTWKFLVHFVVDKKHGIADIQKIQSVRSFLDTTASYLQIVGVLSQIQDGN